MIDDNQLISFLRVIRKDSNVIAVKLINDHLDKEESLDSMIEQLLFCKSR